MEVNNQQQETLLVTLNVSQLRRLIMEALIDYYGPPNLSLIYSKQHLATELNLSLSTITKLEKQDGFPSVKLGPRKKAFVLSDVVDFLKRKEKEASNA